MGRVVVVQVYKGLNGFTEMNSDLKWDCFKFVLNLGETQFPSHFAPDCKNELDSERIRILFQSEGLVDPCHGH